MVVERPLLSSSSPPSSVALQPHFLLLQQGSTLIKSGSVRTTHRVPEATFSWQTQRPQAIFMNHSPHDPVLDRIIRALACGDAWVSRDFSSNITVQLIKAILGQRDSIEGRKLSRFRCARIYAISSITSSLSTAKFHSSLSQRTLTPPILKSAIDVQLSLAKFAPVGPLI